MRVPSHAAVGAQITVTGANKNDPRIITKLNDMMGLADSGKVGLVAKGLRGGVQRGYTYLGGGVYQSDHAGETISATSLRLASATGSETAPCSAITSAGTPSSCSLAAFE